MGALASTNREVWYGEKAVGSLFAFEVVAIRDDSFVPYRR